MTDTFAPRLTEIEEEKSAEKFDSRQLTVVLREYLRLYLQGMHIQSGALPAVFDVHVGRFLTRRTGLFPLKNA